MKIYILEGDGSWRVNVGVFTSKEKANKAWRRWKYMHRNTPWSDSKKVLSVYIADKLIDEQDED